MYRAKTVLAVIPARGGSKGIPRKNIRDLGGKPLIAWTIEAARQSRHIDRVILSSEDPEIIEMAKKWGCEVPFVRPAELAQDDTPGIEPVLHALRSLPEQYDYVILLQPTSPLRTAEDIDACLELCESRNAPACVSVTEPEISPYLMYALDSGGRMRPLLLGSETYQRRQDLPPVYALNGALYVARCDWVLRRRTFLTEETVAYPMPRERSVDIDTELDRQVCNLLLRSSQASAGLDAHS